MPEYSVQARLQSYAVPSARSAQIDDRHRVDESLHALLAPPPQLFLLARRSCAACAARRFSRKKMSTKTETLERRMPGSNGFAM